MKVTSAGIFLALFLGGAFGNASATIEAMDETSMVLTLEVELRASAESVVAHLAFDDEPQIALPLLDRGGGVYGITTETAVKNYAVVFEAIGSGEDVSIPVLLSDLGADFGGADVPTPETVPQEDDGLSQETQQFGWLALALGAASLSVLAIWVVIGRDKDGDDDAKSEEE